MTLERFIKFMTDEIRALKQIVQRSNQAVATKTIAVPLTLIVEDSYTASSNILLRNLSEAPMLIEASFDITDFKQTFGEYLYGLSYQLSADKENPLNRMLSVAIASPAGALTVGQTFEVKLNLTATSDFIVETL